MYLEGCGNYMKKMIMPAVFALLYIVFIVIYAVLILTSVSPLILKIIIGGLILLTGPLMIFVFIQRYKELKEEEKDDLSKY